MNERKLGSDAVLDLHAIDRGLGELTTPANDAATWRWQARQLLTALRETRQALEWALPFARRAVIDAANVYPAAVQNLQKAEAVVARCRDPQ